MTNSNPDNSIFTPKYPQISDSERERLSEEGPILRPMSSGVSSTAPTFIKAQSSDELAAFGSEPPVINRPGDSEGVKSGFQNQILHFNYSGAGWEFFGLYIKNILLTMVTMGIYSFWAKVAVQKYIYNATSVMGRSFSFHATGKEKFIGFAIGSVIVSVFFGFIQIASQVLIKILGSSGGAIAIFIIIFATILFATPWMKIASRKFLLSRSSWSNVRLRFTGDYEELLKISVKGMVLTFVTLGIYTPWYLVEMNRYMTGNSWVGNKGFSYDGDGTELFKIYLKGILLSIVTLGLYGPVLIAALIRYNTNHSSLGTSRFNSAFSGKDMWMVYLAMIFSFGILLPFAMTMGLRLFFEKLSINARAEDIQYIENIKDTGASALADGITDAGEIADAMGGLF